MENREWPAKGYIQSTRESFMENKEEFISLFDFLGRPAGGELGKEVYAASKEAKQLTHSRQVKTKNYTGNIVLYKRSFLNEYFKPTPNKEPSSDYDKKWLPF